MPKKTTEKNKDKNTSSIMKERIQGIGSRMKEARKKAGLTQTELAKRLKCNKAYICRIENSVNSSISESKVHEIAEILDVDGDWLYHGPEYINEKTSEANRKSEERQRALLNENLEALMDAQKNFDDLHKQIAINNKSLEIIRNELKKIQEDELKKYISNKLEQIENLNGMITEDLKIFAAQIDIDNKVKVAKAALKKLDDKENADKKIADSES